MKKVILAGSALAGALMLFGCLAGPRYRRPAVSAPPVYRDAMSVPPNGAPNASMGDLKWSEVFRDERLKELIQEAIANNFDVRIAAQRVLEQQAQVGIVRSQSLPSVSGGAGYDAVGIPSGLLGNSTSPRFHGGGFTAAAAWNLDFWGLYRRQSEAQRAELLATEWGQRAALSSVVTGVASSYIEMRGLDAQVEVTLRTVESRKQSLALVGLRERAGAASMSDVRQAEQLLFAAEARVPVLERGIRELENNISLLLGRNPGPIARGQPIARQDRPEEVPAGIPSQLLERRPDIQRAEAKLLEANARIGVARAQFFPQITLTGIGGTATDQFTKLFNPDASFWYAVGSVSQPLFSGGKLRNNLRLAEAAKQEMVLGYRQAIAAAFRDVSNALNAHQKAKAYRAAQEQERSAASESARLAHFRYESGGTGYLEVLVTETSLLSAELSLADAQQQEALSLVQLYGALGGGWK